MYCDSDLIDVGDHIFSEVLYQILVFSETIVLMTIYLQYITTNVSY